MADIINQHVRYVRQPGTAPFGNVYALAFPIFTDSTGVWIDGDSPNPAKSGDVLKLGCIPAGFRPIEAYVSVNKPISGLAGKIGFQYRDGEDDADVPQKDNAWFTSASFGTKGITRRTGTDPASPYLPKESYLILTASGAPSGEGEAWIYLVGIVEGQP